MSAEFFLQDSNKNILLNFVSKADNARKGSYFLTSLKLIINDMVDHPAEWDARCKYNIQHIGSQFVKKIKDYDFSVGISTNLLDIFALSFRFLHEYCLFVELEPNLSNDLLQLRNSWISDLLDGYLNWKDVDREMVRNAENQLKFAIFIMPGEISRDYLQRILINNEDNPISAILSDKIKTAQKLIDNINESIESKIPVVNALQDKLDNQTTGFNFVGLYKGFQQLLNEKMIEAASYKRYLLILGSVILIPLVTSLTSTYDQLKSSENDLNTNYLFWFLSLLSLEVILIYYFRIVLFNFRSVKTQILQIQLRQTLCQFIQNYVDYSKEAKSTDSTALDKFENLIFSNILADSEKLPSTFDGLEVLTKLANDLRNTK